MKPEASPTPSSLLGRLLLGAAILLLGLWLWIEWCQFPWSPWNDMRLAPAFMLAAGEPVYSAPGQGVIGTWMYGPVPLLLLQPATWMPDLVSAILTAGTLNIGITLAAIAFACARWPSPGATPRHRLAAFAVVIALWPESGWRFIQADNYAVALGLLACLLLFENRRHPWASWVAALAAAAAVGCKQTALGIPVAQVVWLAGAQGKRAGMEHVLRLIAAGAVLVIVTLHTFDAAGLWDTLVMIPGALPFTDEPRRRLFDLASLLAIHLVLPPLLFLALRHRPDLHGGRRLAWLLWACSLPLGFMSLFKTGGTLNSLQGFQLALPGLMLSVIAVAEYRPRFTWFPVALAGAILLIRIQDTGVPYSPRTAHIRDGIALARANPDRLWFPWHPLIGYYAEGRFYHAEDGLYVRLMAGRAVSWTQIRAHLPPRFEGIAEPARMSGWGISERILGEPLTEQQAGAWRIRKVVPPPGVVFDP